MPQPQPQPQPSEAAPWEASAEPAPAEPAAPEPAPAEPAAPEPAPESAPGPAPATLAGPDLAAAAAAAGVATSTPAIDWFGGAGPDNAEALANLFASENPRRGRLVWALQALAANNTARGRSRVLPQITSISALLQSGKQGKTWLYNLGWGPQYDREQHITRWASTCAGAAATHNQCAKVSPPTEEHKAFARDLLAGQVDLMALRGPKDETMPPPATWRRITSFLQHEGFEKIVAAQGGGEGHTVEETVARWGNPAKFASVGGVSFYGRS